MKYLSYMPSEGRPVVFLLGGISLVEKVASGAIIDRYFVKKQELFMGDTLNIMIGTAFSVVAIVMGIRWIRIHKYIMIQDQQWGTLRILFLAMGLLTIATIFINTANNTPLDYFRMGATLVTVTVYLALHDGVGEEGLVSSGKFIPWSEVRSYDYREKEKVIQVFFMVESDDEKKPDEYTTKELDFSKSDKNVLMKFLKLNLGRKYTRMKRK